MKQLLLSGFLALFLCISFQLQAAPEAAVAMPDSYSAQVSEQVLNSGGNAVDAAIAAQFVLAVTLPEAGNIGGGGFMTIYKGGETDFLDYREVAPKKAHKDMYLDKNGEVIPYLSLYGILSSGVPGTVDGMWQAHKKYGSKTWQSLLAPAIKLAQEGFIVHPALKSNINWRIDSFNSKGIKVNFAKYFSSAQTSKIFKQPELAETLKRISSHGRDGFYRGQTAKIISQFMKDNGGIINEHDLASYQSKWRKPIVKNWRDYTVITAPPPSSGGIAILQWLTMYDLVKGDKTYEHNSLEYMHSLAEIGKRVFADRAEYLGDPDFINVPVASLLDQNYLSQRAKEISLDKISISEQVAPGLEESRDTTHFSIVDKWGNAVSNTTTINYTFGSGVIVEGAGFILNDEMDDFSAKAGVANVFGALGGTANEIQPNKRMLSSMSPTILLKNNQVNMVTGSPGGTTIISSVYQSILNSIEFNMSAKSAVNTPRFHHQLWPKDVIEHYAGIEQATLSSLSGKGYTLKQREFGDLQLISTVNGKYQAASQQGNAHRGVALVIK
ncbi:gamma-glutamyltransferase [Litorilituus lipolyticus]|uniref:Glutathione hydrolase proenzyme n=1 Tax=Litorilituus lipolyticus TaxID=2491017 RepID=A0A502KVN9_9GAMM|nr:gamma-glutamyltransferase [Litorilituus lipolyticus]TPH15174.1 gamma-glutamyltransferase [Litorilituus lipolyticus]